MPDCPPNTTDSLPAGSNAADPCSPCFEPTCDNFLSVIAELSRQVCATGNMIKSWNQRLDKFRNRINRLETAINAIPTAEDTPLINPCANTNSVPEEGADGVLGCSEGAQVLIEALEGCGGSLRSTGGKANFNPQALNVHMLDEPQTLTAPGTTSGLTDYDLVGEEEGCKLHAIIHFYVSASGGSGVTNSGRYYASSDGVNVAGNEVGTFSISGGGTSSSVAEVFVPIDDDQLIINLSQSGSGATKSTQARLKGYVW